MCISYFLSSLVTELFLGHFFIIHINYIILNPTELLNLIKGILVNPEKEWKIIKTFKYTWQQVYFYFTIPMVFISAFASLVIHGGDIQYFGLSPNWIFVINVIGSLGAIALGAYFIASLAPRFNSFSSFDASVALISFSYTPVFIASIISAIHIAFALINFIGVVYMVFIFWKGISIMLDTPPHKLMGFTIVNMIILFAVRIVLTSIIAAIVLSLTVGVDDLPV